MAVSSTQADPATAQVVPEEALVHPGEIVAIVDQKGGVGKTTTAVTIAGYLASRGVSVTLIDADEQEGSTTGWLPPHWDDTPLEKQYDLFHVLTEEASFDQALWPVTAEGSLHLVPSFESLKQFEQVDMPGKDTILRDVLEEAQQRGTITLIDCGPSLRQVTATALVAASAVIIPAKAGGLDFMGIGQLNETLARVRRRLNKEQRTVGVLCTMAKPNANLTEAVVAQLQEDYPEAFHATISDTVRVGEASFAKEPLSMYDPRCKAMIEYKAFTDALFAPVLEATRG
ncbi:Chromosome (plasmid) partitioning protein ParA / Sporulation initiation inhibitor protein Soj [Nocardiopsis sp. JB363]|nr:Chromosome (plasmid) partitioning protein ParA / Sporulation initiation inhibitor protein Soj [Nocardiopsis sp. JB363]